MLKYIIFITEEKVPDLKELVAECKNKEIQLCFALPKEDTLIDSFNPKEQSEAVAKEENKEHPFNPDSISPGEAHGALFNTPVKPQEVKTFDEISREIKAEDRKNKIKSALHRVNPFK